MGVRGGLCAIAKRSPAVNALLLFLQQQPDQPQTLPGRWHLTELEAQTSHKTTKWVGSACRRSGLRVTSRRGWGHLSGARPEDCSPPHGSRLRPAGGPGPPGHWKSTEDTGAATDPD